MTSSTDRPGHRRAGRAAITLLAGACVALAGCNIVGPIGFLVAGEEKVEPKYQLPADRSVVVFIDDRSSRLPARSLRERVSKAAEDALLAGGAAPKSDIISSEAIGTILASERSSKQSGIAEVGAAVGARVVVYATVDQFSLTQDGAQFSPSASVRVKVMDAESKERLWPKSPEDWYTLSVASKAGSPALPTKQAERMQAEQELADRMGRAIGNLFVKHVAREGSSKVGS